MSRKTATPAEDRQARHRTLLLLLSRADRGVLGEAEAALLRSLVETELAAGDTARRAAGGQQAAARRLQHRLDAAEQAIIETETEAERDRLARDAFDERKRHRTDMREADRRSDEAEGRAERRAAARRARSHRAPLRELPRSRATGMRRPQLESASRPDQSHCCSHDTAGAAPHMSDTPTPAAPAEAACSAVEVDLDQWRATCELSGVRRGALVRAMARIRQARVVEAQLARLLGESPGPRLVDDVAERVREIREEYGVQCEISEEYAEMWGAERAGSELRRRALVRAVARLRRTRVR